MSYRLHLTIHELPRLQADTLSKWARAKERKDWHKAVAQHVAAHLVHVADLAHAILRPL